MKNVVVVLGLIAVFLVCNIDFLSASGSADKVVDANSNIFKERWASSENLEITINQYNKPKITVTSGHKDFKPSWSKTGDMFTFFRRISKGNGFGSWRTKICVVNADGTGFRELTNGQYPDFNPTWTRDGSNMVIFNRYSTEKTYANQIFLISPDSKVGDEQLISHPSNAYFEWAFSCLKDGRIFMDRIGKDFAKSYLLTPNPGKLGEYEELQRPTDQLWHKVSVSPSETKICYMLDNDRKIATYKDAVIAIADFDVRNLKVRNQIIITKMDPDGVYEYPTWSSDEKFVIYDTNKSGKYQIYAYNLETKKTTRISPDAKRNYLFGAAENLPK